MAIADKPSKQEHIKETSDGLRGALPEELADANAFVSNDSYELLKFHGSYQGYNRDTATERKKAGLDKEHEFMLRLKMPGGRLTAAQYLAMDQLSDDFANGTLRITTRETFQFHCIVKQDLKPAIATINRNLLSTLGGCGDVVRNINTVFAPVKGPRYEMLEQAAFDLAKHFTPRTEQYLNIWVDGEQVDGWGSIKGETTLAPHNAEGDEPIYGVHYLPRKFKIGVALPEDNSIDVLTNDLAFVAMFDGDRLAGYNTCLGGGLGMQHNNAKTYPRLATPVAFIAPEDLLRMAEAVVKLQRDHGDRSNRRHARLKYLVEENGLDWTKTTLAEYFGKPLQAPVPVERYEVPDHMGWHQQQDGKWWLGVPVPSGRIVDHGDEQIRSGLRAVVERYQMPIILAADQNIILYDIDPADRDGITTLLTEHGIRLREDISELDRWALACVALPTCGKALAEAERIREPLIQQTEAILAKLGLAERPISLSISGCPNGCSRPYTGDIGIVGRTPGQYAVFVGGDFEGTRLNEKILDKVPYEQLPALLEAMFRLYRDEAQDASEGFGDFCHRYGLEPVTEVAQRTLN